MDFLIRFVQIHETFRKPEIQALAVLANVNVEFLFYTETVCPAEKALRDLNLESFHFVPREEQRFPDSYVVSLLYCPS